MKQKPTTAPSPLHESIALVADLRKEMENLLPEVDWTTRCHADAEVLAFLQLATSSEVRLVTGFASFECQPPSFAVKSGRSWT